MYKVTLYPRASYPQGGMTLLDTSSGVNPGLLTAVVEGRLNEAGSFTYGIVPSSPMYEYTDPLKYYVSVEEDNDEIFYGRILSVQKNPLTLTKQVTCEGALAFLLDAELGLDKDGHDYSASGYFAKCINDYNAAISNDPARKFSVGTVNVDGASETITYKSSSFTQIQSAIKSQLLDKVDGFLRVRRTTNGAHALDWVKQVGVTNPQPIQITHNVIGQTTTDSGEDIFTLMHPVGKDNLDIGLITISQAMLNQYGPIIRSVTFDADNAATLRTKANAYVEKLRDRLSLSGSISFVDVHYLDGTVPSVKIGDVFTNIQGYEGTKLNTETLTKDLLAPQNDKFTLKNDKDLLRSAVANGANSAATAAAAGGKGRLSSGSSFRYKFIHETDKDLALAARNIEISAEEKIAINTQQIEMNAASIQQNTADIVAQGETWTTFEGTSFYQNKDHITQVAGKYTIDSNGNVLLEEGADLVVSKDGVRSMVGTKLHHQDQSIDDIHNWITTYEGTAIYQDKDHIAQVAGEYIWQEYVNPRTGEVSKKLIIQEGTELYQSRNGGSFGVYDSGNLTAGILFSKLSDGRTSTAIMGDKVYIGSKNDQLDDWVVDTDAGLVAMSARIKTLETDYLKTNELEAKIADVTMITVKGLNCGENGVGSAIRTSSVTSPSFYVRNGSGGSYDISNPIIDVQVVGPTNNQYTLQKKMASNSSSWVNVANFSRATALDGGWSGGLYTVTASPQGETLVAKATMPKSSGTSSFIDIGLYNRSSDSSAAESTRYTVSADNSYAYIKWGSTTVARASNPAYSNGWTAAYGKLSLPKSSATNAFIDIKTPSSTVGAANPDNTRYTVSADNNYAYINWGSTTVARASHSAYSNGYNDGYAVGKAEDPYNNSMSIVNCVAHVTSNGSKEYLGQLYYYDDQARSYEKVTTNNRYWYYSTKRVAGTTTVHY